MSAQAAVAAVLPLIRTVRGKRVILDSDLARLYGVSTGRLNQQARRNQRRFPPDFAFPLTRDEAASRLLQFATASPGRNLRKPPIAYTEHGAVMAANVLNSDRAAAMSVEIVRAFIRLRKAALGRDALSRKLSQLERAVKTRLDRHDKEIEALFKAVESLIGREEETQTPKKRIGFVQGDIPGRPPTGAASGRR
ncbi:MAG: ORF6N domain-containing protein [Elusimicrobia bacterium]|nr:ORF6N domain-containing protein [Elusimicrobiota bacterium]